MSADGFDTAHTVVAPPGAGDSGPTVSAMASRPRSLLASAIGWLIVAMVVFWAFGLVIGWIGFVLRSFAWLVLIAVLVVAYLAAKGPPDD
jgi:hypothetical protein